MSRQRERFLLKEEDRRRTWASASIFFAGVLLVVLALAVAAWLFSPDLRDPGPPPASLLRPVLVVLAVALALLGRGLWARLRPRSYVAVDAGAGTATFFAQGRATREVPLSQLGPLRHVVQERKFSHEGHEDVRTFHVARSGPFPELVVHESEDEMETRREIEAHAKAWGVPYVKPTGEVRDVEDLDVPLFQRLGSDEAVTKPLPQHAASSLAVAWKDDGYEITTSYRPPTDRRKLFLLLLGPPVLIGLFFREPLRHVFRPGSSAALRVAGGLAVLGTLLPGVVLAARAWLRSSRPPVLRISAAGVRFRGKSMPLRSIEEIERVPHAVCRLVSDRRIVEVDGDFCEPSEHEWLRHEVRRLVVELGQRAPAS